MKLARLLGNNHPNFARTMYELEQASGHAGIDTQLLGDITERAHRVMRHLQLDTNDTSVEELYHSLNECVRAEAFETLQDTSDVLLEINGALVSFNLQDVIENLHHELSFEARTYDHAQRHLRMEIVKRYAEHDRTDNEIVKNIAAQSNVHREKDHEHPPLLLDSGIDSSTTDDSKPSVLAIGDIFTDAFIKLNEDVARVEEDESGEKRLSLPLGTKPPYDQVDIVQAVGPAPNAAVAMARLGMQAGLGSFIGDDQVGKEAIEYLQSEGVDTSAMLVQQGIKTSYYFVLRYGAERTILVKNEQFNYTWEPPKKTPDWIYLALISDDSWQFHEGLADYLDENPDISLAFQPGTFHFKWGVEKLKRIYHRSKIIILNREEAVDITGKNYDNLHELFDGLHALGPTMAVITDGPNGSYASFEGKRIMIPNYPDPGPPLDRTGAGDAFASTIVAALAEGETMETALTWAPINSMNVVQHLGAQAGLLRKDEILKFLKEAPEDYTPRDI